MQSLFMLLSSYHLHVLNSGLVSPIIGGVLSVQFHRLLKNWYSHSVTKLFRTLESAAIAVGCSMQMFTCASLRPKLLHSISGVNALPSTAA